METDMSEKRHQQLLYNQWSELKVYSTFHRNQSFDMKYIDSHFGTKGKMIK